MARSFSRPRPENRVENYTARNSYYHPASDTHFEMIEREGKYFQRQFQIGFQGRQTNELETQIDFVMGSGNHARTYLHRTPSDELLELPLGWYAEQGGTWAMNPGYDRPDHAGLSRTVPYGCMFCHNAYPQIPAAGGPRANPVFLSVPEGIDCQRCHGDAQEHVRLARAGSRVEEIRRAVVNPSRLPFDRQLEVCLQCHLEPRSSSASSLIVRYEREPFSYKPGEVLGDFRLHFDQTSATKKEDRFKAEDRFEVVGAGAYRLMQSQCFLRSNGAMTCTTCHDPHREVAARDFVRHYSTICNNCHAAKMTPLIGSQRHTADPDCVACHMPKRRTQDAVHVVMTDHLIQRRKPERDLLAPFSEVPHPETDEVTPYYPSGILRPFDDLYLGVAQVNERGTRSEELLALPQPSRNSILLPPNITCNWAMRFAPAIVSMRRLRPTRKQFGANRNPPSLTTVWPSGLRAFTSSGRPTRSFRRLSVSSPAIPDSGAMSGSHTWSRGACAKQPKPSGNPSRSTVTSTRLTMVLAAPV